jgi:hypothetical protein
MKTCFKCGRSLPLDAFYPHPAMKDGRLGKCKDCTKEDVRANYAAKREQYSAYYAKRNQEPERKESLLRHQRARRARHPERSRARNAVSNALRDGKLERQPCERCESPRSQAHHEDYSRPLDVRWLCFPCHRDEHGQTVVSERLRKAGC